MNESAAPVLINGVWRPARTTAVFTAIDPATGNPLTGLYPVSAFTDAEDALKAGRSAARDLESVSPSTLSRFFDLFAESLDASADDLVETAHRETALPREPRLKTIELPRTTGQLRQAAEAVRDGSWRQAAIDTRLNIRSIREPLGGPVIIFGPSNFPFAFNAASGGDFAASLAAGNPVIAKGHPSHPGTTRLVAEILFLCLNRAGLPPASFQLLYHLAPEDGLHLVAHPSVGASAFTGSRASGLSLKSAADEAGRPIYLEMSGLNPIFLLPEAVKERGEALAADLFSSCSLGAGQFCTKPGLVVLLDDEPGRAF
ncbi:MAG: aldehyde dehydrogenase family protein, partial [Candidatus Aminicenantes bacterium]|nr:aldehyde dehydrogenase family protein [Candidatus Aminicenantes bacterium]